VIGSFAASWLLTIHWRGIAGWRWIFIVEGIPPLILGVITLFYLTDHPHEAQWLREDERRWISEELEAELRAKKKAREYTIWQAFRDQRVLLLILPYFLALVGAQATVFWLPPFIKRLSGLSGARVALWVALPGLAGIVGMLVNGWHSDRNRERRWHTAIPLLCAGLTYLLVALTQNFHLAMALLIVGGGCLAYYPVFWSMPTMFLSESAAAACFGLINSVGHIGGFIGPAAVGYLSDWRQGGMAAGFLFIGMCYLLAGGIVPAVKIPGRKRDATPVALPELRFRKPLSWQDWH